MCDTASAKLNEAFGAGGPTFYPTVEIVAAINEAQRIFCLLTLILETTTAWDVPPATTFFRMLQLTGPAPVIGIVNVAGTAVTRAAGQQFEVEAWLPGITILLNGVARVIVDVGSPTDLTIDTPAASGPAGYAVPSAYPPSLLFPDWIVPLRLTSASGAKIRPSRLDDLVSLDAQWVAQPGAPSRYVHLGADLLALYRQPAAAGTTVNVTYARCPVPLVLDIQTPEIPEEYHPELVNYAICRLRQVEGAAELAKTMPLLASFLDAAQKCADFVRAKNRGGGYDSLPFELRNFDRSRLLKVAPAPAAKRPVLA
jgi:hypothetical protein